MGTFSISSSDRDTRERRSLEMENVPISYSSSAGSSVERTSIFKVPSGATPTKA